MKLLLFLAIVSSVAGQELYSSYNTSSIEWSRAETEMKREKIKQDTKMFLKLITTYYLHFCQATEPVAVEVMDGDELPISICLTQHRLAHQLGSSLLLQEGPVLDPLVLAPTHVIQLCSLLKVFNTLRSVEESLDISLEILEHLYWTTIIVHNQ